ncbi:hypothetical protein BCV70DRAFT_52411 [Testicularia cyperi]|uniref:Uncharacterized protein n=1 Tax=Testicularia cyperi TaxID=1882483 RepID=A0A317XU96_9BASI|nr:hypothetical protein BCV70DRAFT_52411 [Testicularia cyperi]
MPSSLEIATACETSAPPYSASRCRPLTIIVINITVLLAQLLGIRPRFVGTRSIISSRARVSSLLSDVTSIDSSLHLNSPTSPAIDFTHPRA